MLADDSPAGPARSVSSPAASADLPRRDSPRRPVPIPERCRRVQVGRPQIILKHTDAGPTPTSARFSRICAMRPPWVADIMPSVAAPSGTVMDVFLTVLSRSRMAG